MQLFIVFILGAVVLGAGSMLSPAWHTLQPRIALGATLCLALVVGGAVFYAEAFGWDTLVVDYLLFALLSGVVLGGTLSTAQARAEAKGETLPDNEQGWPGPEDLAFFTIVATIILIPLVNIIAPFGTQGQILGFHTLTTRFGESFTSLAPFYPEQTVIVSPGFHAFSAYLSQQLDQPIPMIHMSVNAVVLYLCVWLAYDIGAELQNKRLGRAMALAMLLCGGVFVSYLDGHSTELMSLLFMLAFVMYALRFIQQFNLADLIAGGLMMGAVVYTNLTMSVILILGFIPLTIITWLTPQPERDAPDLMKSRLGLTIGFPLVALIGISPWLLRNLAFMLPPTPSPYVSDISLLSVMILGQGVIIVPLAIWGMIVGLRPHSHHRIRMISMVMLVWLLLVMEFALTGVLANFVPILGDLVNPANIAQHGVIVPFAWFGGLALLNLWETRLSDALQTRLRSLAYPIIAGVALIVIVIGLSFNNLVEVVRPILGVSDATITQDDIDAMVWLNQNTDMNAHIYTPDDNAWLPVYSQRKATTYRAHRYFEWGDITHDEPSLTPDDISNTDYTHIYVTDDSDTWSDFTLLFEQGDIQIYAVPSE